MQNAGVAWDTGEPMTPDVEAEVGIICLLKDLAKWYGNWYN